MLLERSHSQALSRTGRPKSSKNGTATPTSGNSAAQNPRGTPAMAGTEPKATWMESKSTSAGRRRAIACE